MRKKFLLYDEQKITSYILMNGFFLRGWRNLFMNMLCILYNRDFQNIFIVT
jgi:hypothetical protein